MNSNASDPSVAGADQTRHSFWWERPDLKYVGSALHLGGQDLDALASKMGTPIYVYSAARAVANLQRLHDALSRAGLSYRLYYAMKANRNPSLLTYLRVSDLCGIDVCSLDELRAAIGSGFSEEQISFTGTSLSRWEYEALAGFENISLNLDSLHALDTFGRICPDRAVGIRINPEVGLGYGDNEILRYSGTTATKFGVYRDRFEEALRIAHSHELEVERTHFHAGSGYLDTELNQLQVVLEAVWPFLDRHPSLKEVNIGGGLGVPHKSGDLPLDLRRWANLLSDFFSVFPSKVVI